MGFVDFNGFDRFGFPDGIVRVTSGFGGEALLIIGSRKTALLDCGMAYCADKLAENIKRELGEKEIDYILISHTHYDHIGALPFVKQVWPNAITVGSEHAQNVFNRQGAINTINSLSKNAWDTYGRAGDFIIPESGFTIDKIVYDGDKISIGDEQIRVIETKGHTDCSLTFVLEPLSIMFLSESTGVLEGPEKAHVSILKSYKDTLVSVEKCRSYGARHMVSSHYGLIPEYYNERYWELFLFTVEEYRKFLFGLFRQGLPDDEILKKYEEMRRGRITNKEQPTKAFLLNALNVIKVFKKEYEEAGGL